MASLSKAGSSQHDPILLDSDSDSNSKAASPSTTTGRARRQSSRREQQHRGAPLVVAPVFSIQNLKELRDPMTTVFSFLENPSPLHRTCWFLLECFYEHSHYLEVMHCMPHMIRTRNLSKGKNGHPRNLKEKMIPFNMCHLNLSKLSSCRTLKHLYAVHIVRLLTLTTLQGITALGDGVNEIRIAHCPELSNLSARPEQMVRWRKANNAPLIRFTLEDCPKVTHFNVHIEANEVIVRNMAGLSYITSCVTQSTHVTFENLPRLLTVGNEWISSLNGALETVQLQGLPNLQIVGTDFLRGFSRKKRFTLNADLMPRLKKIDHGFLNASERLQNVTIENLNHIVVIGDVLDCCPVLEKVTLRDLPMLVQIGPTNKIRGSAWTKAKEHKGHCPSLKEIVLQRLPKLKVIGEWTLLESAGIRTLRMDELPKLEIEEEEEGFRIVEYDPLAYLAVQNVFLGNNLSKDITERLKPQLQKNNLCYPWRSVGHYGGSYARRSFINFHNWDLSASEPDTTKEEGQLKQGAHTDSRGKRNRDDAADVDLPRGAQLPVLNTSGGNQVIMTTQPSGPSSPV